MVSVGAVAVGVWASGAAALARSCDATSLQDFDVIRDPSLNYSIGRTALGQKTILCAVTASLAGQRHAKRVEKPGSAANRATYGVKPDAMTRAVCRPGASGSARANTSAAVPRSRPSRKT